MEAGEYTQIRLEVNSVRIVVGKNEYRAKVPSGNIKLVGTFEVKDNNTTEITLDFNGEESVLVTGNGEYIFKPVIKLLVEHPSPSTPTVTSVVPNSGNHGQTLDVTITGTNLIKHYPNFSTSRRIISILNKLYKKPVMVIMRKLLG